MCCLYSVVVVPQRPRRGEVGRAQVRSHIRWDPEPAGQIHRRELLVPHFRSGRCTAGAGWYLLADAALLRLEASGPVKFYSGKLTCDRRRFVGAAAAAERSTGGRQSKGFWRAIP